MKSANTYLNFDGNCREAMEFYSKCIGGELNLMPFSTAPFDTPPEAKDRIIHARLTKGAFLLMASDTMPGMAFLQGNNFSISIECESEEETKKLFSALGEGGKEIMPLQDTFWGAYFGMITDRFGVNWMFNFTKVN
ncbi:MAG TPA: VOC family protein [Candidatus Acidoferrum sp.]|nr:VOC family protein [Candidatus Acidoferrum sp.]